MLWTDLDEDKFHFDNSAVQKGIEKISKEKIELMEKSMYNKVENNFNKYGDN